MKRLNTIMLIDDDDTANYINELLILEMGITKELIIVTNGREALDKIDLMYDEKGKCPDLIFLDINMPVMNGFEFLEHYNNLSFEKKDATIIVMLTTSLNRDDINKAKMLNVKGYISKPLLEADVEKILSEHF